MIVLLMIGFAVALYIVASWLDSTLEKDIAKEAEKNVKQIIG